MARAIALAQPASIGRTLNTFTSRIQRGIEILIDGQLICQAGAVIATNLRRGDSREARLLREERENTAETYRLVCELPESVTKRRLLALMERNVSLDRELWAYDLHENPLHEATGDYWQDGIDNRQEICRVLEGRDRNAASRCERPAAATGTR